jgi:A/G-specific adenine glycosylase
VQEWYDEHRRELQWRTTADPYRILVSEVMLQQTQVSRVKVKLPLFLRTFPTLKSLARASAAEVVRAWSGMGYNNRAVRLRDLARVVVDRHRGTLPKDAPSLLGLPGIGPYTAHALLCFAFGKRVPLVDVNIRRVLSRVFGKMPSLDSTVTEKAAWALAAEVLPHDAYTWNQALMDLGATVCTARHPLCAACPLRKSCLSATTLELARPVKRAPRVNAEPSYQGIPQRVWRGRAVEALRNVRERSSISLEELGRRLKPDFHEEEAAWLLSVITGLAKDGLVETRRGSSATHVRLAS